MAGAIELPAGAANVAPLLSSRRQMLCGLILALSNFMVVLDLTVANVSVPHIAGDLGISPDEGTWVITSYAVAEAICVPLTGWLAQRFGAVRVFIAAMFGFGLFSLLCGMSVSLGMLVLCRVGQGICGAPLMPMSQTLMMRVFPPERRNAAVGIWAMTTLLGPALGPVIGGVISDDLTWHWVFLINVPVVMACVSVAAALLAPVETPRQRKPIDTIGLVLLVFWIGCLQLILDTGRDRDWFSDPRTAVLGICAVVGFIVFIIWELTEEHPVVDLHVFRNRAFSLGVVTMALTFGSYFASSVVVPQWLQGSLGYPATTSGIITSLTALGAIVMSQVVTRLLGKVDPRLMISGGVSWLAGMSLMRAGWTSGVDFWTLALPQLLQGLGMAFFMIPLTSMTVRTLPPAEVATGAGMQNFARTMAIAIATALVLTAWSNAQREAHVRIADRLQGDAVMAQLGGVGFTTEQARQTIGMLVEREAVAVALDYVFVLSAVALLIAAVIVWFSPIRANTQQPPSAK